jgi:hypothetical protein
MADKTVVRSVKDRRYNLVGMISTIGDDFWRFLLFLAIFTIFGDFYYFWRFLLFLAIFTIFGDF